MRFNPAKCQFKQRQVKFFGLILTPEGVVPDPAKIEALRNLPEPKDEKLLQSFLGMVNYLSRFNLYMANMTHNLRALFKKRYKSKVDRCPQFGLQKNYRYFMQRRDSAEILQN